MTDMPDNVKLADLVESRLKGLHPSEHDVVLEYHDWDRIIAALRAPAQVEGEENVDMLERVQNLVKETITEMRVQGGDNDLRCVQHRLTTAIAALTRPTAAPDGQGNICDCCNHSFLSVYRVPNDVWRKIAPKPDTLGDFEEHLGGGVLCLSCAERRAREQGYSLVFDGLADWPEADDEAVRLLRDIVEAYDWWQVDPVDRGSCADEVTAARAYLTRKGSA